MTAKIRLMLFPCHDDHHMTLDIRNQVLYAEFELCRRGPIVDGSLIKRRNRSQIVQESERDRQSFEESAMSDVYYRTGQAAKLLGISTHHLRRLCEAVLVEHELTSGGHYQIPLSEIERMRREGVPPIPQTLESESSGPVWRGANGDSSPSESNRDRSSEDVRRSAEEVAITANQIRKRRLELEAEELEDRFRERAEKQEKIEEQRLQQAIAREAAEDHRQLIQEWTEYSLNRVPPNAPHEVKTDVYHAVEQTLKSMSLDCPSIIRSLVDAAVEGVLAPWKRKAQFEEAVQKARASLPYAARGSLGQPSEWEFRAMQRASAAISDLRDNATPAEMEVAAQSAGEEVKREFEHYRACEEVVSWSRLQVPSEATLAERGEAEELVREALQRLPLRASRQQMESARDTALAPLKRTIEQREQQRRAQKQAEAKRRHAAFEALHYISYVDDCLREEYEFDSMLEQFQTSSKLKKQIEPLLVKQLLHQDMSRDEIRGFIRKRIDERI
jgi:hypothetical protein